MGARVPTDEEGRYKYGRGKTGISHVMLGCSGKRWREHRVSEIHRDRDRDRDIVNVYVCISSTH